jgi:uncharacterized protein
LNDLLEILSAKSLKMTIKESSNSAAVIEFDVFAKPNSKVEKVFVGDGVLIIQTRSKPVDGEANQAIVEAVANVFGVGKAAVEILRGDKSRHKRIKLLVEITAKKSKKYYLEKFTSIF